MNNIFQKKWKKFSLSLIAMSMLLISPAIITAVQAEPNSPVGETFGSVIEDQRVAAALIKRYNNKIEITYDENGIINNEISQHAYDNIKDLTYIHEGEDSVSLKGVEKFKNINSVVVVDAFFDSFPENILELVNLKKLSLRNTTNRNQESFSLPDGLRALTNLESLSFNNTNLNEIPVWITELTNLKYLNLVGSNLNNKPDFKLPEDIEKLENLETLELSNNHMKELPKNLHKLEKLKTFRFVSNALESISSENYEFIKNVKTKYVMYQDVLKIKDNIHDKDYDLNVEMAEIIPFLLDLDEEEISYIFYLTTYNEDFTENTKEISIPTEEIYQNGEFHLDKKYIQEGQNFVLSAVIRNGLFEKSWYNYRFVAEALPKTVNINFIDTADNEIKESEIITGRLGEAYTIDAPQIEGYKLKEVIGTTEGTYTEEAQEVTYVYYTSIPATPIVPIEMGDVTVTYEDTKGNKLEAVTTLNGQVGKDWTSVQKEFEGYKFKEVIGTTEGTYTEEAQEVTYVYYTSIPATPIEDTAKPSIPSTEIEDNATTTVPETEKVTADKLPSTGMSNAFTMMNMAMVGAGALLISFNKKEEK